MERGSIVHALLPSGIPSLDRAVAGQDRPPDVVSHATSVLDAAPHAAAGEGEWLWLLDGSVTPEPAALGRLLAATAPPAPLPPAVLLAAKVVDAHGELALEHAPWYRRGELDLAMRAALERVVPVRAALLGCILVRGDAAAAAGAPIASLREPDAALEWTARLLRRGGGYLVPTGVARARDGAVARPDPAEDARLYGAMLASGAFAMKERLWLGQEAAGRARAARRGRVSARVWLAGAEGAAGTLRDRARSRARARVPGRPGPRARRS